MTKPPIQTKQDYALALARVETLMETARSAAENDELDALVTLIEVYEDEHFPMSAPIEGYKE